MPTHRSGRGREAHLKIREGSYCPPGGPRVVGRTTLRSGSPFQRSRRDPEAHTEVW